MSERAYTVREVDELRRAIENKWLYGSYRSPAEYLEEGGIVMSCSYSEKDKSVAVEQMVRTHMLAGHTACDLLASEEAA